MAAFDEPANSRSVAASIVDNTRVGVHATYIYVCMCVRIRAVQSHPSPPPLPFPIFSLSFFCSPNSFLLYFLFASFLAGQRERNGMTNS